MTERQKKRLARAQGKVEHAKGLLEVHRALRRNTAEGKEQEAGYVSRLEIAQAELRKLREKEG